MASQVHLRKERRRRLEAGHPFVYQSEVASVTGDPQTGDAVQVVNHQGHFLAWGFYHETSQIAVRCATYDESERLDQVWMRRTVTDAWNIRKRFLPQTTSCRAIYGEADGLPGVIVDKYGDTAVVQILSAAMDQRREVLAQTLCDVLRVTSLWERSDAPVRLLEGLEPKSGPLVGNPPAEVEIVENGVRFIVDLAGGQKTGHFFDQRENHASIAPVVRFAADERPRTDQRYREGVTAAPDEGRRGARVLDVFCHTGGFALHALHYGAAHVTAIDSSLHALQSAERNMAANGFSEDQYELIEGNAFDILRDYSQSGQQYDVVILDPPAFAKSRQAVEGALRGYKDIHLRALRLLREGGFLVTASCSSHVNAQAWLEAIAQAAQDARKILRVIERRGAAIDHPALLGMPENEYLKFAILEVKSRATSEKAQIPRSSHLQTP
ncbi:MAG: class I SAM-dependent rRNA methyltransferase [Firmicutes bacterium]|nr:class I SAM-dependent rRNA methyltransferase [Bacillota bacterium]